MAQRRWPPRRSLAVVSQWTRAAEATATRVLTPHAANNLTRGVWGQRGGVRKNDEGGHELIVFPEHHRERLARRKKWRPVERRSGSHAASTKAAIINLTTGPTYYVCKLRL